jgi:hypothetical protein
MGLALGELHWSAQQFWDSTVRELMTAYAYLVPEPVNTFKPFTDEEKAVFEEIKERLAREERLANGG